MSFGSASINESSLQNAVQPEQPDQPNEPEIDELEAQAEADDDIARSDSVESQEVNEPVDDNYDNAA